MATMVEVVDPRSKEITLYRGEAPELERDLLTNGIQAHKRWIVPGFEAKDWIQLTQSPMFWVATQVGEYVRRHVVSSQHSPMVSFTTVHDRARHYATLASTRPYGLLSTIQVRLVKWETWRDPVGGGAGTLYEDDRGRRWISVKDFRDMRADVPLAERESHIPYGEWDSEWLLIGDVHPSEFTLQRIAR